MSVREWLRETRPRGLRHGQRQARALARLGSALLLLGAILTTPATSLAGGDPNWASQGFTDITGGTLAVDLDFTNMQGTRQTVNVEQLPPGLAPAAVQKLLDLPIVTQPLSTLIEQQWNQSTAANAQPMRATTCASIQKNVQDQVGKYLNKSVANFGCNLATTGVLAARVQNGTWTAPAAPDYLNGIHLVPGGQSLTLSYWLPGNTVSFTIPLNAGPIPDPSYTVTFDGEMLLIANLADNYPATCTDSVFGWSEAHNANVKASNVTTSIEDSLASFVQALQDQPTNLFQGADGQIDATVQGIGTIATLQAGMDQFLNACNAGPTYGFTQLQMGVQNGTVAFTFTHPDLPTPQLTNLAAQHNGGSFLNNLIGVDQLQAHPGDTVNVHGFFDIPQVTSLQIGWNPPRSDLQANVRWGPQGQQPQTVQQGGAEFDATNLTPNTRYDFQVQVCDLVGCSAWSDPLSATTNVAGTDTIIFKLASGTNGCQANSPCPVVGRSKIQGDGTVAGTITVPASAHAGKYTLQAQVGAGSNPQTATTPLRILAANAATPALLAMWDPYANRAYDGTVTVVGGIPFTLHGEGFGSDTVTVALDNVGGPAVGTINPAPNGTFTTPLTMPYASIGSHTLVASQRDGTQATLAINVSPGAQ